MDAMSRNVSPPLRYNPITFDNYVPYIWWYLGYVKLITMMHSVFDSRISRKHMVYSSEYIFLNVLGSSSCEEIMSSEFLITLFKKKKVSGYLRLILNKIGN